MALNLLRFFPPPVVREANIRRPYENLSTGTVEFMRQSAEDTVGRLKFQASALESIEEDTWELGDLFRLAERKESVETNTGRYRKLAAELHAELMLRRSGIRE